MRNQRPRYVEERITACLSEHGTLGFAALLHRAPSNQTLSRTRADAPRSRISAAATYPPRVVRLSTNRRRRWETLKPDTLNPGPMAGLIVG